MMRALLAALALCLAAGAQATATPGLPMRTVLEPRAPAAFVLVAKATIAKRCGSRGGVRRTRSYYSSSC